jgi:hypothetical protein
MAVRKRCIMSKNYITVTLSGVGERFPEIMKIKIQINVDVNPMD